MSTKMKGLLKGLRYISQIFDEDKEPEMQIGFPTDVKHVAHIGWDGPSVDSPSWLKEFKGPGGFQSAPLVTASGEPQESPQVKWVSEDSKSKGREAISSARGNPDAPRSSRRRSAENSESSTMKEASATRKGSRRQSKESSSDSVKSSYRQIQERGLGGGGGGGGGESNSGSLPDIPKKSRRKKSKDAFNGGSSRPSSSRSKPNMTSSTYNNTSQFPDEAANGGSTRGSRSKGINSSNTCTSHFSNPELESGSKLESGSVGSSKKNEFSQLSVVKLPNIAEKDNGSSGVS